MIREDQRLQLKTTVEVQRLQNDILKELRHLAGQGKLRDIKVAEHLSNLEDPVVLGIKEPKEGAKEDAEEDTKRHTEEKTKRGKKKARTRKPKADYENKCIGQEYDKKQEKRKCIGQEDVKLLSNMFIRLSDSIQRFPTAANIAWPRYSVLKGLWYQGMRDRQQTVPLAHSKTLNWIFDGSVPENYRGPHPRFIEWLEYEDGIFWVHGKPGSGKSTLMKFFASHPTTRQLLEQWAGHGRKQLVFASHFFWIAGGMLQRSQRGLLRTLLFNILRDCPALVPCVYPDQEAIQYPVDEWTFQELREAFNRLKSQNEVRICLFIDGLDEYDPDTPEGSYQDLIKTLMSIGESPDIKICISSRSWYVFKDAFSRGEDGEVSKWAVALEHLNRPDIEAYVRSSFSENERFRDLSNRDPRYPALLDQVVQKSQGVFLWVFLVVRSLLRGLTFADRVSDLQKRLDQIPDDLNDYFEQILGSVDKFYLKETAEVFQIMLESRAAVPLLAFSFFFEEENDYAFKIRGWCPMEDPEISRRCDETRRRLDGRCRGLVDVDTNPSTSAQDIEVRFLHRTVRDFLENKAMEKLFSKLDPQFDAHVSAARAFLALIKTVPARGTSPRLNEDETYYSSLIFHSRRYEVRTGKALVDVLDEAQAVEKVRTIGTQPFLEFAAMNQLWLYLLRAIETNAAINERYRDVFLHQAVKNLCHNYDAPEAQDIRKDFIKGLLDTGASPNKSTSGNETPWDLFLRLLSAQDAAKTTNQNDLFEMGKVFIVHGAHSSTKDEVKIILGAKQVLPTEQRTELVRLLLKSRRFRHLVPIKRGSKIIQGLIGKALKKLN